MEKDLSILIGGKAGQGSRKAGLIIAKIFNELGYHVFIYDEYQSLIRGGHSFSKIRVSKEKIASHNNQIDFLLALDKNTIEEHKNELNNKGKVLYNCDSFVCNLKGSIGLKATTIVSSCNGIDIMENIALIASFSKTLGIAWNILEKILKKELAKKLDLNLKIAKKAFNSEKKLLNIENLNKKPAKLLTGNEALSLGALKAGLDLYLAYPMTPATGVLHFLAEKKDDFDIKVAQLENEIGVINAAIGAAYAGAKTMIGTSGGGFALMSEGFSVAVQNETPLVLVESQRMSPGSGVPTYNGQGDLSFALNVGHGDIEKFVAAPGDANGACFWAGKLLNLSWKYQTPSILLIDKEVSESTFSFDKDILKKIKQEKPKLWNKGKDYLRYKDTKTGISPMAFPGQDLVVKSNTYEHDEYGLTVEDPDQVKKMQEKRLRKFKEMKKEVDNLKAVEVYGNKNAKKAIIAWGSTKGPARDAAKKLNLKMIFPVLLQPFPEKQIKKALKGVEKLVLVETNGLAQLGQLLARYGIKPDKTILKYDARVFGCDELKEKLSNF